MLVGNKHNEFYVKCVMLNVAYVVEAKVEQEFEVCLFYNSHMQAAYTHRFDSVV